MNGMDKLRGKVKELRMTNEEFAARIGINPGTLYRKMKSNGLSFTVGEMHKIVDVLGLTTEEAKAIFLR